MIKELICITCPIGCQLSVEMKDGRVIKVSGHTCLRGERYAKEECTHPKRMLTSTVVIEKARIARLPVVSSAPLPKESLMEVMEAINQVVVKAPIHINDLIIRNVCGLGVDILASRSLSKIKG